MTTESGPSRIEESLREMGIGSIPPHPLCFVDAFHETVGLPTAARQDTVDASSEDLTSLGIAISRLQDRLRENSLLVFDSLTSPYLMSGAGILSFSRRSLLRLAAEGNAVLACLDEGCGREEDLVAMMSISNGVIRMEAEEGKQVLKIVKHPKLRPTRIEVPIEPVRIGLEERVFNPDMLARYLQGDEAVMRGEVGDFVNILWPNLAHWSGMLWDPKRFPMMVYEMNKDDSPSLMKLMKKNEALKRAVFPLHRRLLLRLMPKSFSKVKDMKNLIRRMERSLGARAISTHFVSMPPSAVKTIEDLIYWQYAKIISESAGFGKGNYRFIMDRFKKLQAGEIEWSSSIREWIRERENPDDCIYCGATGKLTVEHMIPLSRGGLDHSDNAVLVCSHCNSLKGDRRLYEFFSLEKRNMIPRIAEGKYLKLLYTELGKRDLLGISKENISELCDVCDLEVKCPVPEDMTVYCLEGVFTK